MAFSFVLLAVKRLPRGPVMEIKAMFEILSKEGANIGEEIRKMSSSMDKDDILDYLVVDLLDLVKVMLLLRDVEKPLGRKHTAKL